MTNEWTDYLNYSTLSREVTSKNRIFKSFYQKKRSQIDSNLKKVLLPLKSFQSTIHFSQLNNNINKIIIIVAKLMKCIQKSAGIIMPANKWH